VILQIRKFEKRDTRRVIKLANDHALFDGPIQEDDLKITDSFPEGFLVAEDNEEIVGFVYGFFKDVPAQVLSNWGVSRVATIELLVVDPEYRRQSMGTSLLERLVGVFKQAGTDLILLTCPVQAEAAKHLYEKIGFKVNAYHMRMRV